MEIGGGGWVVENSGQWARAGVSVGHGTGMGRGRGKGWVGDTDRRRHRDGMEMSEGIGAYGMG